MTAADFWEQRYASAQVWSGHVNASLADVVAGLVPGRALDLGCGEGGDALWLAGAGWRVTAVDISATALERGRAAAAEAGLPSGQIEWVAADLASWRPVATYDLVSACFLQSPVSLPRSEILRRAAAAIAPGGSLVIVAHAEPPPWASEHHQHHHDDFLGPEDEVAALDLDPAGWDVVLAEVREREATGPDGEVARLTDTVVQVRRVHTRHG